MNWAGLLVSVGLITLVVLTLPYGLVLLAGLAWVWWRS